MPRLPLLAALLSLLAGCATTPPSPAPAPAPQPQAASEPAGMAASQPAAEVASEPQATTASEPVEVAVPTPPPSSAPRRLSEAEGRALLERLLPPKMPDRAGWTDDILDAFTALKIPYSAEYFCASAAVIEQESSWQGDPGVPGLPAIVWKAIDERASRYHVPLTVVKAALLKPSPTGASYKQRIDTLSTERQMNDLFEDMAREASNLGLPLNMRNPIRTGGPMQVSVEFAENHVRAWPYPYAKRGSVRQQVFTRRGGTYFGIANLLHYPAPYSEMIYRFADYNAGRYASRNVAFQQAVERLTGKQLSLDGDLLRYQNGRPVGTSDSQAALYTLGERLKLSREAMLRDLQQEKMSGFGNSETYKRVFALADAAAGKPLPRAALPQIRLKSPKITRKLTTEWFAERVNGRYQTCLARRP
ncbi:hypothetical protein GCM10007860_22880 [Chitiniphilus shinanonensis]|uniref:Lipoprotein n=1 Tax=Chitiniphilus shinanonensis TaxID=553088 RepID=A0ABQ6BT12_9NEIS|nr:DUF1615 domain-containing protein [Chitiniphilus shinanonensis]GLS05138.1 hypothetical protein GCM10007860_22880 [Chitiniphilus shinanonensis]